MLFGLFIASSLRVLVFWTVGECSTVRFVGVSNAAQCHYLLFGANLTPPSRRDFLLFLTLK